MIGQTRRRLARLVLGVCVVGVLSPALAAAQPRTDAQPRAEAPPRAETPAQAPLQSQAQPSVDQPGVTDNLQEEVVAALGRLPLAAVLGAALALRPRRKGTPIRQPAVIQTQIILSVVGALIMLVVGASLARAFGIVGAANLIRYRSKIEDPKDAVVMLCTLSLGLTVGVGLYGLAILGTLFIGLALWVIESFDPQTRVFELRIKLGDQTEALRPKVEQVFKRFKVAYELRTAGPEEVHYLVKTPIDVQTDRVSTVLTSLVPDGKGSVEWDEKKADKAVGAP